MIQVLDLIILTFKTYPGGPRVTEKIQADRFRILEGFRKMLTQPASQRDLKQLEYELLYYFNEGSGEEVDFFWAKVREEGLNFEKKDNSNRLALILKKGRLNFNDYRYLLEDVLPFKEEKNIDDATVSKLNKLLLKYEMAGK